MNKGMGDTACHQYILDHFNAHAIKGALKTDRTYEVVESSASQLRIRSRNKTGKSVQTLFADLKTCKSLKYGEFRRVDIFWGVERKTDDDQVAWNCSGGDFCDDDSFDVSPPGPKFLPNGDLMPVDDFINRRIGKSKRSKKEKAS